MFLKYICNPFYFYAEAAKAFFEILLGGYLNATYKSQLPYKVYYKMQHF